MGQSMMARRKNREAAFPGKTKKIRRLTADLKIGHYTLTGRKKRKKRKNREAAFPGKTKKTRRLTADLKIGHYTALARRWGKGRPMGRSAVAEMGLGWWEGGSR